MKISKIFLILAFIFLAMLPSAGVFAAFGLEINYPTILGISVKPGDSIVRYAAYFFNIGMFIGGTLAAVVIVIGGAFYLLSFAKPKLVSEGKEWVKAGVFGLILLLSAYLIAYTINPDLVYFKLDKLKPVLTFLGIDTSGEKDPKEYIYYQEIPIGTLTETLMSKTMYCYDFDPEGNPIPLLLKTDKNGEILGPTYRNVDRVQCLLKIMDAAQKKAKVMSDLGQELKKMMETCKCEGKCDDPCNKNDKGCNNPPVNKKCTGPCAGQNGEGVACQQPAGTISCCSKEMKEKIEHGPVEVGCDAKNVLNNNQQNIFASNTNNEFLSSLKNNIFLAQILPNANNNAANNNCKDGCENPLKKFKGLDEFRTKLTNISPLIEKKVQVDGKDVFAINIDGKQGFQTSKKWNDLKLAEQLIYFKEKIKQIEDDIKADVSKLNAARAAVANCYDVKSSVDFIKIKEGVKKEDNKVVLAQSWTGIDSSKYCKGFNYSNSGCYNTCNKICPDATPEVAKCYEKCVQNKCDTNDTECLSAQQQCIEENCYNKRPCNNRDPGNSGGQNPANFGECISICQQNCSNFCAKTYLVCSDDYKLCIENCSQNSQCILDNQDTCLINSEVINTDDFQKCLKQNDEENIKNCVNNSYLCKYGSDEHAGYQDCTNGYTGCSPNLKTLKNNEYSSSYIFDNKQSQICPDPYTTCLGGINAGQTCLELYPKASKCPSNSFCPNCPCGETDQTIKFSIQNPNDPEEIETLSKKVSARELITGECNDYTYNTDPLTFYCKVIFEETKETTGENFQCSAARDIPVGQTVDDAKAWAKKLTDIADQYVTGIQIIFETIEKITDKRPDEYCRCDSKFDNGKPICKSSCKYSPSIWERNAMGVLVKVANESCALEPCNGNACQQMIDYMSQLSDNYVEMRKSFIDLLIMFLKDGRTDPLKKLSYSREAMSSCSVDLIQQSQENVKTLSCTRAYPNTGFLSKRCYGILEGQVRVPPVDLTDDWFCCQKINK